MHVFHQSEKLENHLYNPRYHFLIFWESCVVQNRLATYNYDCKLIIHNVVASNHTKYVIKVILSSVERDCRGVRY